MAEEAGRTVAASDTQVGVALATDIEMASLVPIRLGRITALPSVQSSLCLIAFTIGTLFAPVSPSILDAAPECTVWSVVVSEIDAAEKPHALRPILPSQA
jgi:hypothetical protein